MVEGQVQRAAEGAAVRCSGSALNSPAEGGCSSATWHRSQEGCLLHQPQHTSGAAQCIKAPPVRLNAAWSHTPHSEW